MHLRQRVPTRCLLRVLHFSLQLRNIRKVYRTILFELRVLRLNPGTPFIAFRDASQQVRITFILQSQCV